MEASFCLQCGERNTCKSICKPLEKRLKERDIAGYSTRHKRRKERLFPIDVVERIGAERAFELRYGKSYLKKIKAENIEHEN